jgi:hypothetical protein
MVVVMGRVSSAFSQHCQICQEQSATYWSAESHLER